MYQFTVEAIPFILSAIFASLLTIYVFVFFPRTRTNNMFVLMTGTASLWGMGYVFDILAADLPTMVFWLYFQYLATISLPVFFFLFCLSFTHYAEYFFADRRRLIPLFIPGMFNYGLLLTNPYHELFYNQIQIYDGAPFPTLIYNGGLFYWAHILVSSFFVTVGMIILFRSYQMNPHPLHRKQIIIFTGAVSVVLAGNIIDIFELLPFSVYLDITPLAFMVFSIIFLIGLYNFDLLEILPAAHNLIFRTTNLGIVITTLDHRIIDINPQGWTYIMDPAFSGSPESVKGNDFFSLLTKQQKLISYVEQIRYFEGSLVNLTKIPNKPITFEMEIAPTDQSRKTYFRMTIETLHEGKNLMGFVYVIRDVTAERKVTTLLETSNEFKQSLLNIISHDLKNSIHVIRGFTDLLRSNVADRKTSLESERYLEAIALRAREMEEIIDQTREYVVTLDTQGLKQLELKPIDLQKEFTRVRGSYQIEIKKKELKLQELWPLNRHEILTLGDYRIGSVLRNLLDNAIKFSPHGGIIEVEVTQTKPPLNPRYWLLRITDFGPGIPENIQSEIFKPFASIGPPEKRGSGFGLSITYNIVQSYQGKIWVEKNEPNGTSFFLTLPIYIPSE